MFGNPGFPGFINSTSAWPNPIQSVEGGDGYLQKVSNGTGGGPYPATGSIYYGGFSAELNNNGGTLAVVDAAPLSGLNTVAFQIGIGEAWGYDLLQQEGMLSVSLSYTLVGDTTTYQATNDMAVIFGETVEQVYNGTVDMPTGPEDVFINLRVFQWDLSDVGGVIDTFQIGFTAVQHAQLYSLRLDQTTTAYGSNWIAEFAEVDWTGEGTTNWSDSESWEGGAVPKEDSKVRLSGGSEVVVDSNRRVSTLTLDGADGYVVRSSGGSALTVTRSINGEAAEAAHYTIEAPVVLEKYGKIDLNENTDLEIKGNLSGVGFSRAGAGSLVLSGNNTFNSNNATLHNNGIIFAGGDTRISGTNTLRGNNTVPFEIRDGASVTLHGGDQRIDSKFNLVLRGNARLQLGDEEGRSDLKVAGLAGGVWDTGAKVVSGGESVSTLTSNVAAGASHAFVGMLGGSGENENALAFTKQGKGVQILSGTNTYHGPTRIEDGMLQVNSAAALSANSNLVFAGGVLGLGGGNFNRALGTGAGEVEFQGDGGFAAFGANREVNIGGAGEKLVWGEGRFLGANSRLLLGDATATHTVDVVNAIDLGSSVRTVDVRNNGNPGTVDGRLSGELSGSGGLRKTGNGMLALTGDNSYTGATLVENGTLVVTGADGSLSGDLAVRNGAIARLSNTTGGNNADRLGDTARVLLNGGTFETALDAGISASETTGELVIEGGANVVKTAKAGEGQTNAITFASISRQAGATVRFTGDGLGVNAANRIYLNSGALANGVIGGWAMVGTDFATYDTTDGVKAFSGYSDNLAEESWTASSNVRLSANATLTGDRQLNTLKIQSSTARTVDLGGNTLRVETGGILTHGNSASNTHGISNGTLTAGAGDNTAGELIVTNHSATAISANITNNGTGSVSLTKAGNGVLQLNGTNTYSGHTSINEGTLTINGSNTGGGNLTIRTGATLLNNGVFEVGGTFINNGTLGGEQSLTFVSRTALSGSGTYTSNVVVDENIILAPGNSPGTMTFSGGTVWAGGGEYLFEINDATGTAGVNWDLVSVTGGDLAISATLENPFALTLAPLTFLDTAGSIANFDPLTSYNWTIATVTGGGSVTGFDAGAFSLDTSAFLAYHPEVSYSGSFSILLSGDQKSVYLSYEAVPEPGTWALMIGGGGLFYLLSRRRAGRASRMS